MQSNIRNFCILAHVDHGKSTLADRFLEITKTVPPQEFRPQFLDTNPISRERGITIKLAPVRMIYRRHPEFISGSTKSKMPKPQYHLVRGRQVRHDEREEYIFNLIDTPGHVDFSYEVSRSLAAVEGAILLVDASKGIQAQTLSYFQKASQQNLVIVPVINKIDLPAAQPEETALSVIKTFGFSQDEIIFISAKTGEGIKQLLKVIIERIPPPKGDSSAPLRALVFDSFYDVHKGVVVYVRIVDGQIGTPEESLPPAIAPARLASPACQRLPARSPACMAGGALSGRRLEAGGWRRSNWRAGRPPRGCHGKRQSLLKMMASGATFSPLEMGYLDPQLKLSSILENGSVGFIATGLKDIRLARVGETITEISNSKFLISNLLPLPGYKQPKPMVFAGVYPLDKDDYQDLQESLDKLQLNDASLTFQTTGSQALGKGFLVGFLGPLHAEVTLQRLEREFGLQLVATAPNVEYEVRSAKDSPCQARRVLCRNIFQLQDYDEILEPVMKVLILTPQEYLGGVLKLCQEKRGKLINVEYVGNQARVEYRLPLSEIIVEFFERLKSISSGFASFDYQFLEHQPFDGVRLDILIGGKKVDALSVIVPKLKSYQVGRELVERLARVIPKQMFEFAIQAAIGEKIIARATKKAWRKDVTAKLYGGDQTRKDKLLQKQKKGKKKMKAVGKVFIPQEAFLTVLKKSS